MLASPISDGRKLTSSDESEFGGTSAPVIDWTGLVDRIRNGDPAGMEDLYHLFARGIRYYLFRNLGSQDLDDKIHDTFLIVVQAIRRGDLREPERLMGFVRTIVRRQVASHIEHVVQVRREESPLEPACPIRDHKATPEECAITHQQMDFVIRTLRGLSVKDREILTRFYLQEQSQEKICREMDLSDTQFRLLKSRAKARFGELGRRRMAKKPASNVFLRILSACRH